MSLMQLTAVELGKKIKAGEVSVVEATEAALAAIEAKEEKVNSCDSGPGGCTEAGRGGAEKD